ncbi:hypothetical protein GF351_05150 [Candidatus Woesearchaeota archaeon]|nr:hypothetical protein [Candidatus Woesearchaeota archaeon]
MISRIKDSMVYREFFSSLELFRKKVRYLALPFLFDLLFFVLFVVVLNFFAFRMLDELVAVRDLTEGATVEAYGAMTTAQFATVLGNEAQLMAHMNQFLMLLSVFVLVSFLIYVLLQGVNWYLTDMVVWGRKFSWRVLARYSGLFFLLNLVWLAGLLVIFFVLREILFWNTQNLYPLVSQTFLNYASILLVLVYLYFVFISYALLMRYRLSDTLKKTLQMGFRGYRKFVPMYLILAAMLAVPLLLLIPVQFFAYIRLMISLGFLLCMVILLLAVFSFARIYISCIVRDHATKVST